MPRTGRPLVYGDLYASLESIAEGECIMFHVPDNKNVDAVQQTVNNRCKAKFPNKKFRTVSYRQYIYIVRVYYVAPVRRDERQIELPAV